MLFSGGGDKGKKPENVPTGKADGEKEEAAKKETPASQVIMETVAVHEETRPISLHIEFSHLLQVSSNSHDPQIRTKVRPA